MIAYRRDLIRELTGVMVPGMDMGSFLLGVAAFPFLFLGIVAAIIFATDYFGWPGKQS
jgi:hypothetical protein